MNIENKISNKTIEFSSVPNGEIFLYDEDYFLAIETLEDDCCNRVNAINLSEGDGQASYFDDDAMVLWVKSTITIESR